MVLNYFYVAALFGKANLVLAITVYTPLAKIGFSANNGLDCTWRTFSSVNMFILL